MKCGVNEENMYENCVSDDLLCRYVEGEVTKAESRLVQKHLNSCSTCLKVMASLIRTPSLPLTQTEEREIDEIIEFNPEKQVAKILSIVEKECPGNNIDFFYKLWESIRGFILFLFGSQRRLAIGFACIILMTIILGRPQYKVWRSNVFAKKGMSNFVTEYAFYSRDELRPVGGFEYDEFAGSKRRKIYKQTKSKLTLLQFQKALRFNSNNLSAHHYMGTHYLLIDKNYDEARNHYMIVLSQDSTNASILNDLGIVDLYQGYDDEAEEKFSLALQYDPHLLEAQYNLAELYERQQKIEQAKEEWEKYLTLDSTSIWADVVRAHLDGLLKK